MTVVYATGWPNMAAEQRTVDGISDGGGHSDRAVMELNKR